MEEETTIAQEEVTEEVEQAAPPSPEEVAKTLSEALGVEVTPESLDKIRNLDKWEKKLRKTSMEVAEKKREAPVSETPSTGGQDVAPEFDEATLKALDAYYQKKLAPTLTVQEERFKEDVEDAVESFLASHADLGEDSAEVITRAQELWTKPTIKNLKSALSAAYAEKRVIDPEKLEKEIREKVLKELEAKGEEVVEVKPKRGGVAATSKRDPDAIIDDPNMDWKEKARLLDSLGI